jgi:hypothetical protein
MTTLLGLRRLGSSVKLKTPVSAVLFAENAAKAVVDMAMK